jgi:predicted AAA+ superfamily ATPase
LSSEFATLLSGRTMQFELYPFSFREFLSAKNIDASTRMKQAVYERVIKKAFQEYVQWGGFPEVVLAEDTEQKKEFLINYYTNIVYKDIIPRFNIENVKQTQELARYLLSNIGKINSYNKLSALLHISDKTVREYINDFSQAYLLFEVNKYAFSLKNQMTYLKKVYTVDTGFSSALGFHFSEDAGRFLENVVFIELKRKGKEIYYHKEKKECDFIIKQGNKITEAVQVCKELNQENKEREVAGLIDALLTHNVKKGLILTMDQEDEFQREGCKISVTPLWKWLLAQ